MNVYERPLPVAMLGLPDDAPVLVGELEWWAYVPHVHRALANPDGREVVPSRPSDGAALEDWQAYWMVPFYLLVYNFGWTDPGRGLKWWLDADKPIEDPRFELLRRCWDRDASLDLLAAWLWRRPQAWRHDTVRKLCGLPTKPVVPVEPGGSWWASLDERFPTDGPYAAALPHPLYGAGGTDLLHLGRHIQDPLVGGPPGLLLRGSSSERRAVLILATMRGWFGQLVKMGSTLPSLGSRSWYIDVVCRPVGFLGTYRKSRETGMWFAGRHRYHAVGN